MRELHKKQQTSFLFINQSPKACKKQ